ncbi:MAG: ATP-binding cassette domain-containing protein [Bacteroidetes bacterium]|nr:ATP-binding cassette domain-containing protein [Bacteroidota bacterium]
MKDSGTLASFKAEQLSLKRGARVIWDNANWEITGPTAILGSNGMGKSSTLAMLAGQLSPDAGDLVFRANGEPIEAESWMTRISLASPWLDLPSHLTLEETLRFHGTFRREREGGLGWGTLIQSSGLSVGNEVPLRLWSSGQRQRLALALALGTESSAVLLDEPASNLDAEGTAWFQRVLAEVCPLCTVVVATNDEKKEAPKDASLLRI